MTKEQKEFQIYCIICVTHLTLRNSSDCQSHRNLEIIDCTSDPRASMDRVIKMSDIDEPNSNADQ